MRTYALRIENIHNFPPIIEIFLLRPLRLNETKYFYPMCKYFEQA